jgi:hypothetical protein
MLSSGALVIRFAFLKLLGQYVLPPGSYGTRAGKRKGFRARCWVLRKQPLRLGLLTRTAWPNGSPEGDLVRQVPSVS